MQDLLAVIQSRCKAKGDAITDLALDKLTFKILGPLAKPEDEESKEELGPMRQVIQVKDLNTPWQAYKMA